jgi:hypothetical protein
MHEKMRLHHPNLQMRDRITDLISPGGGDTFAEEQKIIAWLTRGFLWFLGSSAGSEAPEKHGVKCAVTVFL